MSKTKIIAWAIGAIIFCCLILLGTGVLGNNFALTFQNGYAYGNGWGKVDVHSKQPVTNYCPISSGGRLQRGQNLEQWESGCVHGFNNALSYQNGYLYGFPKGLTPTHQPSTDMASSACTTSAAEAGPPGTDQTTWLTGCTSGFTKAQYQNGFLYGHQKGNMVASQSPLPPSSTYCSSSAVTVTTPPATSVTNWVAGCVDGYNRSLSFQLGYLYGFPKGQTTTLLPSTEPATSVCTTSAANATPAGTDQSTWLTGCNSGFRKAQIQNGTSYGHQKGKMVASESHPPPASTYCSSSAVTGTKPPATNVTDWLLGCVYGYHLALKPGK